MDLHGAMMWIRFSSMKNNICNFGDKVLFSRCVLLESGAEWVSNNVSSILFSVNCSLLKTFILLLNLRSEIHYFNFYTVHPLGHAQ